jgi:hypothetical protein
MPTGDLSSSHRQIMVQQTQMKKPVSYQPSSPLRVGRPGGSILAQFGKNTISEAALWGQKRGVNVDADSSPKHRYDSKDRNV